MEYITKKIETITNYPSIKVYVNKIENRITIKIKKGYHLKLLIPKTMTLLGSTKSKINKNKNRENVSHLEITEVVIIHCDIHG